MAATAMDLEMPETLGGRVALLRVRLGLTQEEFASAVGLHPVSVYRIEHDKQFPRADTLRAIAELGDVPVSWLFPGDDSFFEEE